MFGMQWRVVKFVAGEALSFKANFASVWIEWSSINPPLKWLLADWLLFLLSIPYHNFYTYIGTEAILDLKKLKFSRAKLKWFISYLFNGFIKKLIVL